MKIGFNLLLWTGDATEARMIPVIEMLAAQGYDGVELPIFGGSPDSFEPVARRIAELGLECTVVAVRNAETDAISPDAAVRERAVAAMRECLDCCEVLGARLVGGPFYAAIGQFSGAPPSADEWKRAVEVLGRVAEDAAGRGIALGLEFLNRFEIYLLNSTDDTARMVRDVGAANLGVHYDTFHAHIEEKDPASAIERNAERIVHVHISESDRSTPGAGQVRWRETFDALQRSGYDGWLTVEAFGRAVPELAAATKIWRNLFESEEQLARDALAFIRREWSARADA